MTKDSNILCIGSVLWDVIGRSPSHMAKGADVPGRIIRIPGGVALNIAMTLVRFGLTPALLSAVGRDAEGEELISECHHMGLITDHVYRSDDLPTDCYMAVEGANGLIAAIADAHSLEKAGAKILQALYDGRLGKADAPYSGLIALDGNLTERLLDDIANDPAFQSADLRIAPASPGKAERLLPFLRSGRGTLYVNLEEAGILCHTRFSTSEEAGQALLSKGAARALVTNGGEATTDAHPDGLITLPPPEVLVTRVTGAGDTFMAAHIAAEFNDADRTSALAQALDAAAKFVSGDTPS
ncbi:Sugar or nucleoside kinase, ribokinase family [Thalassococcus halodurans]|uniref:Sugar or nucleoside kinase, ribokinase family n=1 Tax=Thalassococcus halodurans TaxID=373675 RepID=A0A1H5WLA5_9RHOB|nr:PfkB family carbohydrate kinase [Thalassococcus halodurans]SEG00252.1 Sugar or nucleoside kinase, ribokinase family [Thalassococcus halodurans]